MYFSESLRFSFQALNANKVRSFLTALGLVIGNASVILVVTISITSRDYVLDQIRGVGSNLISAQFSAGTDTATQVDADFIKLADVEAVRQQFGSRIVAATGVMTNFGRMLINGKEQDVRVIGSDDQYPLVRNMRLLSGHFMDQNDVEQRQHIAMLTEKLAQKLFGSTAAAVGRVIKLYGLQFTVIGTFKERTGTMGISEIADETVLMPITVIKLFMPVERVDPMYAQARYTADVLPLTAAIKQILESRHRPGAKYDVFNLSGFLEAAEKIAWVLTLVLVTVSAITLIISGIGIMNIMLVTVTERTREIGLRMAVGASRKAVLEQFLTEAVVLSVSGGLIGILIGISIPLSVRFITDQIRVPISPLSIVVAFGVSLVVGVVFGMLPANRAAKLNPTEALRYE
ncbi:MAG TPA: ABC transporter permease [Bryobacteraceae bacterium]|jgi:putative ABC transport system permease protein|nr:ABC transporter permease [Bryobacteraceae bacterium]